MRGGDLKLTHNKKKWVTSFQVSTLSSDTELQKNSEGFPFFTSDLWRTIRIWAQPIRQQPKFKCNLFRNLNKINYLLLKMIFSPTGMQIQNWTGLAEPNGKTILYWFINFSVFKDVQIFKETWIWTTPSEACVIHTPLYCRILESRPNIQKIMRWYERDTKGSFLIQFRKEERWMVLSWVSTEHKQ